MSTECPYCGSDMWDCDSGEPDYEDGYWCDGCGQWISLEELNEIWTEEAETED